MATPGRLAILGFALAVLGVFATLGSQPVAVAYYYLPFYGYLLVLAGIPGGYKLHRLVNMGLLFGLSIAAMVLSAYLVTAYGLSARWTVLGLIQHSDAQDFTTSIADLLTKGWFDTPRGRPLANLSLAGLLSATGFDMTATAIYAAVAGGAAILLVSVAVAGSYGRVAGLVVAAFLFDYAHEFAAGISSEIPGFIVGTAAAAMLLHASKRQNTGLFLCGMALFTLGMIVRPGVLFLLPLLLGWAFFWLPAWRGKRWLAPLAGLIVVGALFAANGKIAQMVTPNSGGSFVNAADSWYAVFTNGREALGIMPGAEILPATRWRQIYVDNPEIEQLPVQEQASKKLEIIIDQVLTYPLAGFVGALLELKVHFVDVKLFRFVEVKPIRYLLYVFFVIGAGISLAGARRDPDKALLAAVLIGTAMSIPFMYGGESRGFAASVALLGLIVAQGVSAFGRWIGARKRPAASASTVPASGFGILVSLPALAVFIAMGIGYLAAGKTVAAKAEWACPAGMDGRTFLFSPGSQILFVPDDTSLAGTRPGFTVRGLRDHFAWQRALAFNKSRLRYVSGFFQFSTADKAAAFAEESGIPVALQQSIDLTAKSLVVVAFANPEKFAVRGSGPVRVCAENRDGLLLARIQAPAE